MFRRFFSGTASKTITSAAVIVAVMSLVSRLLGLLRDRILAGEFGAGTVLDTYYAAFRIPDLVYNLLVVGALSAGFIPVFTSAFAGDKSEGHRDSWALVSNLINCFAIIIALLSVVLWTFSLPLTRLIAPGFSPAQTALTAELTRIMLLSPVLLGVSAIFSGVLQSRKSFFVFSLAPILYNVGISCGALFLVPRLGVSGLAWGVVLGAVLHLLIQLPAVVLAGFRHRISINVWDRELRQIVRMMGPRTLSLAFTQLNFFVVTVLASLIGSGSLSVFTFANNMQSFPLGIFAIPFAIAAFPTLSELVHSRDRFVATLSQTLRQVLFLIIPSAALLILLRAQIVRLLLGSGRFDWNDTVDTFQALAVFSISLFAQALIPLLIRAFYALRDTATPLATALGAAVVNVTLAVVLVGPLGVMGLATAWSIANILQLGALWVLLRWRLGGLDESVIFSSVGKIALAAVLLAVVTQGFKYVTELLAGTETFIGILFQGGLSAAAGIGAYVLASVLMRSPEAMVWLNLWRWPRPATVVEEVMSEGTQG